MNGRILRSAKLPAVSRCPPKVHIQCIIERGCSHAGWSQQSRGASGGTRGSGQRTGLSTTAIRHGPPSPAPSCRALGRRCAASCAACPAQGQCSMARAVCPSLMLLTRRTCPSCALRAVCWPAMQARPSALQARSSLGVQESNGQVSARSLPAGPSEASKVDTWLRTSSARPLEIDTEAEHVEMGAPAASACCTHFTPSQLLFIRQCTGGRNCHLLRAHPRRPCISTAWESPQALCPNRESSLLEASRGWPLAQALPPGRSVPHRCLPPVLSAAHPVCKLSCWLATSRQAEAGCAEVPPTPHHVDRNKCAHRGCHRKFNWMSIADVKHSFTRHYCSICQNVYCHRHTHYSPHGNLGSCGMESKCICQTCFAALPKVSQVHGLSAAGASVPGKQHTWAGDPGVDSVCLPVQCTHGMCTLLLSALAEHLPGSQDQGPHHLPASCTGAPLGCCTSILHAA